MSEYNNIPKIRFKGFTDVWEQRKLEDISNRFDNLRIPVAANVREKGTIPYYGANGIQDYVKRFTHNGEFVLIAEDGANDLKNYPVKYVNGLFWANNHVHVIQGKKEICDNKYLKYCFSKTNIEALLVGGGRAKLNANIMMGIDLKLCQFDEQSKIGELFYEIDNLITLHQRKCDKLINIKKSMLEKMFPKNSSNIPEIRFKGFTDVWEQRKLGEVGYAKSGQGFPDAEQGGTRGIPFYKVSDMNITGNENELITANNYVTQEQINRNHWNVINDVPAVFFAKVGAAVMLNRKRLCRNSFLLDNNTMAYMFDKSKWNYNFGKTMFDTIDLTLLAQVGAIPSYNASDVENIEILMPHLKEQGKIGELFTSLDNLITLHQRKVEKLNNIKKSMLEKMFV